jgi:hypothetical protein
MTDAREPSSYLLPSTLVHTIIGSILTSILAIGGYMVAWALNDRAWKAAQDEHVRSIEAMVVEIRGQLAIGILPKAEERINRLDAKDQSLEKQHEMLERRIEALENGRHR